jgi:hypothetical protein
MLDYEKFITKLASIATSYSDDTVKCMELVMHFQSFFDTILTFENKYLILCDSDKLKELLDEADIVKRNLFSLEEDNGEVLQIISTQYPLFNKEIEFGITSDLIEKYLNILYTVIYIYENNSVSYNTYREMGVFITRLVSNLTNQFLNNDNKDIKDNDSLDKLMEDIHL